MTDIETKPYPCCDKMVGPILLNGKYCRPVCDVHGYQVEPKNTDTITRQAVIDTIASERLNGDTGSEGDAAYEREFPVQKGMTLRDYFAGQALVGICSVLDGNGQPKWALIATDAYKAADAMLAARDQSE